MQTKTVRTTPSGLHVALSMTTVAFACRCLQTYTHLPDGRSHVVCTAWAMLALMEARYHKVDRRPLDQAARHLLSRQLPNGDWPQEEIIGVFNRNCMITYANYRNIFPIWALGMYKNLVLGDKA